MQKIIDFLIIQPKKIFYLFCVLNAENNRKIIYISIHSGIGIQSINSEKSL